MSEKFKYEYDAPSQKEKDEIYRIRNKYTFDDNNNDLYLKLKKLDNKVQNPPTIISITLGVIGILTFGLGITFFLEWQNIWFIGIPFFILGLIIICFSYPIYKIIYKVQYNKYSNRIIELANELLKEE